MSRKANTCSMISRLALPFLISTMATASVVAQGNATGKNDCINGTIGRSDNTSGNFTYPCADIDPSSVEKDFEIDHSPFEAELASKCICPSSNNVICREAFAIENCECTEDGEVKCEAERPPPDHNKYEEQLAALCLCQDSGDIICSDSDSLKNCECKENGGVYCEAPDHNSYEKELAEKCECPEDSKDIICTDDKALENCECSRSKKVYCDAPIPKTKPPQPFETKEAQCENHPECVLLGLSSGACCPSTQGGFYECCDNYPAHLYPAAQCENHPKCVEMGLSKGACCPSVQGGIYDCCDNYDGPVTGTDSAAATCSSGVGAAMGAAALVAAVM